ncbi:MAG: hypothetical protein P8H98_08140 [Flavobacteriales bacterium]|nr:hypothetical protein [Flavobacteriales bacterium]
MKLYWISIVALYLIIIGFIQVRWSAKNEREIWTTPKKQNWIQSGLMLTAALYSINNAGLVSGIITNHGISGVYFLWSGFIGIFIFPLVFAPLWAKLNFLSENDFILKRYRGKWAASLFHFRAYYLGLIIIPIILCFGYLALIDLIETLLPMENKRILVLVAVLGILIAYQSSFKEKSISDVFHVLLFIAALVLALVNVHSNESPLPFTFVTPNKTEPYCLSSILIFIGLQWWSSTIYDGSGQQAQQMLAKNNKFHALKAATLSNVINILFTIGIAILSYQALQLQLGKGEAAYLQAFYFFLPEVMHPILVLGLFGMFVSTHQNLCNWAGGMLYSSSKSRSVNTLWPKRIYLILPSIAAFIVTLFFDALQDAFEFLLGISAGVGPVFTLRWFWWRITAQIQLASMLGALLLYPISIFVWNTFPALEHLFNEAYPFHMLFVSCLNLLLVLMLAFMLPSDLDYKQHLQFKGLLSINIKTALLNLIWAVTLGAMLFVVLLVFWVMMVR